MEGAFVRVDLRHLVGGESTGGNPAILAFWSGEVLQLTASTQTNQRWSVSSPSWFLGRGPIDGDRNGGVYESRIDERRGLITMFPRGAGLLAYCGTMSGTDGSGGPLVGRIGILRRGDELRGVYYGSAEVGEHHWGYFTADLSTLPAMIMVEDFPRVLAGTELTVSGNGMLGLVRWEQGGEADFTAIPCQIPANVLGEI